MTEKLKTVKARELKKGMRTPWYTVKEDIRSLYGTSGGWVQYHDGQWANKTWKSDEEVPLLTEEAP